MSREIILMRHGQPKLVATDKMSARDMKDWIEQYNQSEIINHPVPDASMQLAATAKVIVSSSAPRALTSVQALACSPPSSTRFSVKRNCPMVAGNCHGYRRLPGHLSFESYGCAATHAESNPPALRGCAPARQLDNFSPLPAKDRFCCSVMVL